MTADIIYASVVDHRHDKKAPAPPRFKLVPFRNILLSTAPAYLVKGIIPSAGMVIVWGPPKCGKSFWTYDLAMHITLGRSYRGRRVQHGPVVYLALEGGRGFRARVEAWRRRHLDDHDGEVPFYLLDVPVDLIADRAALIQAVGEQLGGQPPAAVVIDTLNRALVGDENKGEDMAKFIRAADMIRVAFACAVIVVHHCGIQGGRPRGHTSLPGADDAQIAVERNATGNIVVTVEHMKDGEAGAVIVSRLEPVDLGTDDEGDAISSCVIVPADGDALGRRPKVSGAAKLALELLERAILDAGEQAPASNHIPRDIGTVPVSLWRSYCYEGTITESDGRDTKRKAFLRVSRRLQELGLIGIWHDRVWIAGHAGQGGTNAA